MNIYKNLQVVSFLMVRNQKLMHYDKKNKEGCLLSLLLFMVLKMPANAISQEKEIKDIHTEKEEIKLQTD